MTNYVKVRPHVARALGVEAARYRYADGNYLIWDKELRQIDNGYVFHPEETVARIGGLLMDPYRNKEEQQKTAGECTPLPEPTDPAWATPEEEALEIAEEILEAAEMAEVIGAAEEIAGELPEAGVVAGGMADEPGETETGPVEGVEP